MDEKKGALAYITDLQMATRDPYTDDHYFYTAHQYMVTSDLAYIQKKMKSIRIPFGSIEKGEKFDQFSHEPFDVRSVVWAPYPKMGNSIDKKYDQMIDKITNKK